MPFLPLIPDHHKPARISVYTGAQSATEEASDNKSQTDGSSDKSTSDDSNTKFLRLTPESKPAADSPAESATTESSSKENE